jgi:hypothetical protein
LVAAVCAQPACWRDIDSEAPKPAPEAHSEPRTDLNLLGKTNAQSGESRRNENVQFNLIDNNSLKELNTRTGTTATLFAEFRADRAYFGSEFGVSPVPALHLTSAKAESWHGNLYFWHGNSVLNARSFFTAGELKPAHENQYGAAVAFRLSAKTHATLDGFQNRVRGFVNGNVLVPKAGERTPRANDPVKRALIQKFLDAFPAELPNRTDVNERALNTNAPQALNDNNASLRLDHQATTRDAFSARYQFTSQFVDAFQLVAGQNPDTTTKAHMGVLTWSRAWTAQTVVQASAAFDRVTSLLVPEPNAVGPQVNFSNVIAPRSAPAHRFRSTARRTATAAGALQQSRGTTVCRRRIGPPPGERVRGPSHRGNLYFRNDFDRDVMTNFLLGIPSRFSGATGNATRAFPHLGARFLCGGCVARDAMAQSLLWSALGNRGAPSEAKRLTPVPYPCDSTTRRRVSRWRCGSRKDGARCAPPTRFTTARFSRSPTARRATIRHSTGSSRFRRPISSFRFSNSTSRSIPEGAAPLWMSTPRCAARTRTSTT